MSTGSEKHLQYRNKGIIYVKCFNEIGRRIPTPDMRVFGEEPSSYYSLKSPNISYKEIHERLYQSGLCVNASLDVFSEKADQILRIIETDPSYSNLLEGVHIPFALELGSDEIDLGHHLEHALLPKVERSFSNLFPECHFKAVLQGDSDLQGHISVANGSNYDALIDSAKRGTVVGWYFPQALQEFDIASQRKQMSTLPDLPGAQVCLSGGMDIGASLVGTPGLLVNEDTYAPILCMSSYQHTDERLILLMKSYGPHLEFWCMTQMLTKDVTQVSEQWAGGITIFSGC
jgi:hypothetical protein